MLRVIMKLTKRRRYVIAAVPVLVSILILSSIVGVAFSIKPHYSFDLSLEVLWQTTLSDLGLGNAFPIIPPVTLGDVDGDGMLEAVFCTTACVVVVNCDDGTLLWYYKLDDSYPSWAYFEDHALLFDVDGDGLLDVIVGFTSLQSGWCFALRGFDGKMLWNSKPINDGVGSENLVLVDINNDNHPEVIFGKKPGHEDNYTLYILDPYDGRYISQAVFNINASGWYNGIAVEDLDGDGGKDAVFTNSDGYVVAYSFIKQEILWQTKKLVETDAIKGVYIGNPFIVPAQANAQVDIDPIVIVPMTNSCYALNGRTGAELWSFSPEGIFMYPRPIAIGDLDADGKLEVIITGYHRLYVLDLLSGSVRWSKTFSDDVTVSPTLADCDGDRKLDIIVGTLNYGSDKPTGNLYIIRGLDGTILSSYRGPKKGQFSDTKGVTCSPVIADLDNDGLEDLLVLYSHGPIVALHFSHGGQFFSPSRLFWNGESGTFNRTFSLATIDPDYDGLSVFTEKTLGTNPYSPDTDNDSLPDLFEYVYAHTSPVQSDTDYDGLSDALEDPDHDGFSNYQEYLHSTNPLFFDSDSDLLPDGFDPFPHFPDGFFYYSFLLFCPSLLLSFLLFRRFSASAPKSPPSP